MLPNRIRALSLFTQSFYGTWPCARFGMACCLQPVVDWVTVPCGVLTEYLDHCENDTGLSLYLGCNPLSELQTAKATQVTIITSSTYRCPAISSGSSKWRGNRTYPVCNSNASRLTCGQQRASINRDSASDNRQRASISPKERMLRDHGLETLAFPARSGWAVFCY